MVREALVWGKNEAPNRRIIIGERRARKYSYAWLDSLVFIIF